MIGETTTVAPLGPVSRMVAVHPALREHFARPHIGFADGSTGRDSWVEYPNGMVTIIVNVGEAFGGHPSVFVAGLTDTPDVVERDGPIECLDLKLTPPGARRLLGVPLAELTGTVVALCDVLGPGVNEVADRFATRSTWDARARILETALLRRAHDRAGVDRRVEWAWRRIMSRHGTVSTHQLADEVGWSQRHLISSFRRQLGLTPRKLARITRFNAVLPDLRDGTIDGASLAARHGYADQSHLIREVHEFTGVTPAKLAGSRGP
ncbi:MAG: AraC family transcriptional regulator [Humibacillus sp.]|nr:AraC family transcriptional regulator [Humibacillus sp.]MDN5777236.1 AraC family transcriptional regulator [Humibacillus sp.]